MSDKIREAFEHHAKEVGMQLRYEGSALATAEAHAAWRAWQAALAQQSAPVAVPGAVTTHPLDQVEWWANAYEQEGGHALIVEMLRAYLAMLATPAAPVAQEPVAWQFREIGEGEWQDCDEAWHDYCCRSPQHDTRRLYTAPPAAMLAIAPAAPVSVGRGPVDRHYPNEEMDAIAVSRYRVGSSGAGTLHRHAVRAGDGEQELWRGSESDCKLVARRLAGAFLDGGLCLHALLNAAPPAAEQPDTWAPSGADYDARLEDQA